MNFDSERVNRVYNESRGRIVRSLEQHTDLPDGADLEQFVSKFTNEDFTREKLEKAIIASQQEGMQYVYNQLDEEAYLFIYMLSGITDELINTLRRSAYDYYCREEFSQIEDDRKIIGYGSPFIKYPFQFTYKVVQSVLFSGLTAFSGCVSGLSYGFT